MKKYLTALTTILFSLNGFAQCPQLMWSDEFEGATLDLSKWSHQEGDGCAISNALCGWGNNELQWYSPNNLTLENGFAVITAKRESSNGSDFTSSRIRSINKGDFKFGRIEARMKLPEGQGFWPAFWMLSTDDIYGGWPQSGEIDIMEYRGDKLNETHGTIHFGQVWPNNQFSTKIFSLNEGTFSEDFHDFSLEWTNQELRWYVDGYLYSKKTRGDLNGQRWPFDQDFHLLLNLAVGGNFSGNPNSGTPFPQRMEIDYVRVYDMVDQPFLSGDHVVSFQEQNSIYRLQNVPDGSIIEWSVPATAELASGSGTSVVQINWGNTGGLLKANLTNECGSFDYSLGVKVDQPFAAETVLENFDEAAKITRARTSGTFTDNVANPAPDALNDSELCGKYERSGAEVFDVLFYDVSDITNAADFITGDKRLTLDIFTESPVGTTVLIQLENKVRAQGDYPQGRHSRFQTETTKQGVWERLEFTLLDRPDGGVSHQGIDQLVFLFAPNTSTSGTFYFDNFEILSQITTSTKEVDYGLDIIPNPVRHNLHVNINTGQSIKTLEVIDCTGKRLVTKKSINNTFYNLNLSNLVQGLYYLKIGLHNGDQILESFIKQ